MIIKEQIKIFCLPHAGGSASIYYKWQNNIDSNLIKVIPIEYKGHGMRLDENYYQSFNEMIEDLLNFVKNELGNEENYILFGHSMGGYAAFELERILEIKVNKTAKHVILSGLEAPYYWKIGNIKISEMEDSKFLKEVMKYGGIDFEVLREKELMNIILPIIKNDFRIIESIDSYNDIVKLKSPITIMNGKQDRYQPEHMNFWKEYSSSSCNIKYFDGGHFYINENVDEICNYIGMLVKNITSL